MKLIQFLKSQTWVNPLNASSKFWQPRIPPKETTPSACKCRLLTSSATYPVNRLFNSLFIRLIGYLIDWLSRSSGIRLFGCQVNQLTVWQWESVPARILSSDGRRPSRSLRCRRCPLAGGGVRRGKRRCRWLARWGSTPYTRRREP